MSTKPDRVAVRLPFDKSDMLPITNFSSRNAWSTQLGSGKGESHAHVVTFEPGGEIGEHETGFGQLFIVVAGSGWVVCESERFEVGVGDAIFLPRGVQHAKGSEAGMTAVMLQSFELEPATRE